MQEIEEKINFLKIFYFFFGFIREGDNHHQPPLGLAVWGFSPVLLCSTIKFYNYGNSNLSKKK
jgi:hypothetical protein